MELPRFLILVLAVYHGGPRAVDAQKVPVWTVKGENNTICMKLSFFATIDLTDAGKIEIDNSKIVFTFDPKTNCSSNAETRVVAIGRPSGSPGYDDYLKLTFERSSKGFTMPGVAVGWYFTNNQGHPYVMYTRQKSINNYLPSVVPLGCSFRQDEPITVAFDGATATIRNMTLQPFSQCTKDGVGEGYPGGTCTTTCSSGNAAPLGTVPAVYLLFVGVVGAFVLRQKI